MGLGKLFAHLLVLRSSGFSGKVFVGILSILCRMQAERDLAEEEFMSDLFVHTSDDRVVLLPPMNGCGSDESLPSGDSRLYLFVTMLTERAKSKENSVVCSPSREAYKNLLAKSLNMKIDASSCPGS
ncbi:uncharacterized protein LOC123884822 isoform X2 [Trifolium pratense]|uniref:uncharacterized protein LOC123884822 isoform X2 n=1 Tax=Trifolium pratense TaxID=57577 RepID=UPI001E69419F|nr:uncharacterized protein LOC123884822 isoform X2 [Trifolium pratense]